MKYPLAHEIYDAINALPLLLYDTPFSLSVLTDNRPYRNIGDLLVVRAPSVRQALRLCGTTEAITNGTASDYEAFRALCLAAPMLTGHVTMQSITEVLSRLLETEAPLSPYTCDMLWESLSAQIEEQSLRPSEILTAFSVESLGYRVSPLAKHTAPYCPGVDCYRILDLGTAPSAQIPSSEHTAENLESFLTALLDAINTETSCGAVALHMQLPHRFAFERNSKKMELEEHYRYSRSGKTLSYPKQCELDTAIAIAVASRCAAKRLPLLLTASCHEQELIALYRYLSLNHAVPETVLYGKTPANLQPFLSAFAFRTERGLPGLLPISRDIGALAPYFPLGAAILPCSSFTDPITLGGIVGQREALAETLAILGDTNGIDGETLSSLAEDIVYGNVKNRFGI